jgi:hypothetical protein
MWLLAGGSGSGLTDPAVGAILSLLQVPVFGYVVVALIRGWLVSGREHDRVVGERDRERDERIKAQSALTEQVLPTLTETQHVLADAARVIDRVDPLPIAARRRTAGGR